MKSILIPAVALLLIFFITCNNNADKKKNDDNGSVKETPKTTADSLMGDVMESHNVAMSKYGKLHAMQNEVQRLLDSIVALPAKTQQAAMPLKAKLNELVKDLKSAKAGMDKWMDEFNLDSAVNNMGQRIKYLAEEKLKVSKIKESILSSLQKADSILKKKN